MTSISGSRFLFVLSLLLAVLIDCSFCAQLYTRCSTNIVHLTEESCLLNCFNPKVFSNVMCQPDGATGVPCAPLNESQVCVSLQCLGSSRNCPVGMSTHKVERLFRLIPETAYPDQTPRRGRNHQPRHFDNYNNGSPGGFSTTYTYTYTILSVLLILILAFLGANRCFKHYSRMFKGSPVPVAKSQVPSISVNIHPLDRGVSHSTSNLRGCQLEEGGPPRPSSAPPPSGNVQVHPSERIPKDMPPPYAIATRMGTPPPSYDDASQQHAHSLRYI